MAPAVTIFNSPLLSLRILLRLGGGAVQRGVRWLSHHCFLLVLLIFALTTAYLAEGPHQAVLFPQLVTGFEARLSFVMWWLALGVASSIGLGTGLHTFVLYLAPYIAKVTLVAYECNAIPAMLPSRWNYHTFADCPTDPENDLSFWDIVRAVQLESFLWGVGTALGELPPYFVSRAARLSGKKTEGLEDFSGFWGMVRRGIFLSVKRYAFITVLLCASIPNPLFDLAGLLCGHFGVNFWVFFGATFIGKAFIKVHIQMLFTILLFSEKHLETLLTAIQAYFPSLQSSLSHFLENQKRSLHSPEFPENKAFAARVWELFILCMVGFFLVSILNSLVQNELVCPNQEKDAEKIAITSIRPSNTNSKAK